MTRLDGKAALITGAARGIDPAFAGAYVGEGAQVAIADINFGSAEQAAGALGRAAIAPILVFGWMSQRQLVRGLTFGAVK